MIFKTATLFLLLVLAGQGTGEEVTNFHYALFAIISIVTAILDKALNYE